jgi:hypothetical protein
VELDPRRVHARYHLDLDRTNAELKLRVGVIGMIDMVAVLHLAPLARAEVHDRRAAFCRDEGVRITIPNWRQHFNTGIRTHRRAYGRGGKRPCPCRRHEARFWQSDPNRHPGRSAGGR